MLRSHENKHDVIKYPSIRKEIPTFYGILLKPKYQFPLRVAQLLKIISLQLRNTRCSKNLAAEFNRQPLAAAATIHPLDFRFVLILASPCFISHVVPSLQVHRAKFCTDFLFLVTRGSALIIISSNPRHFLCLMPHSILRKPLTCTIE